MPSLIETEALETRIPDHQIARVTRVIQFMDAHLDRPLRIADLAKIAGLSTYRLSHVFREVTGISPIAFFSAKRIERAKRLLMISEAKTIDVCLQIGYESVATFSKEFKRWVGTSPSAFRKSSKIDLSLFWSEEKLKSLRLDRADDKSARIVCGTVRYLPERVTLIGAYAGAIPMGMPFAACVIESDGCFQLKVGLESEFYLLAVSLDAKRLQRLSEDIVPTDLLVASCKIDMDEGRTRFEAPPMQLRKVKETDPPIVTALQLVFFRAASRSICVR